MHSDAALAPPCGRAWRTDAMRSLASRGAVAHRRAVTPAADRAGRRRGAGAATWTPCARCCKQGADVNAAQGDGMTALHWAAMQGDAEIGDDAAVRGRQRRAR